ncbi:MAG TPA: hypothetical protein VGF14_06730 [Alphaproteobacteria bacterium]
MNNSPTNAFIESLDQNPYIDDTTRTLAKSAAQEDAAAFFDNAPQASAVVATAEAPVKSQTPGTFKVKISKGPLHIPY